MTTASAEMAMLQKLIESFGSIAGGLPALIDRVSAVEALVKTMSENDGVKTVSDAVEALRSKYDRLAESIRRNNPFRVPGLEDERQKYSMVRAMAAVRACGGTLRKEMFERVGAGFEWEASSQARELAEKAGHYAGNEDSLGLLIPEEVSAEFVAAIYTMSRYIGLDGEGDTRVSVIDGIVGQTYTLPGFKGGVVAHWVGEGQEFIESLAKAKKIKMERKKLGALIRQSNELGRSISAGAEAMLRRDMVRAMAKKLDHAVPYGAGTDNEPTGVFNNSGVQVYDADGGVVYDGLTAARDGVADWATAVLDFDGLAEGPGALEDADIDAEEGGRTFSTISHPKYFRGLRKLKVQNFSGQTEAQPYLLGAPMIRPETLRALIGDYAGTTQSRRAQKPGKSIAGTTTATASDAGDVVMGTLSEIIVGRWSGLEIEDDGGKGKLFTSDESLTKVRMYCDICVREPKAIVVCPNAQIA